LLPHDVLKYSPAARKDSSSPSKDGGIEIIIVDNIRNIKITPTIFSIDFIN
jgi:hypothetical protein